MMLWVIRTCFLRIHTLRQIHSREGKKKQTSLLLRLSKAGVTVQAYPVIMPFLACSLLSTARDRTPGHLAALPKPFSRNKPA